MTEFKKGKGLFIQANFNTTNLNDTQNKSTTAFDEMTFRMQWKCSGVNPTDCNITSILCPVKYLCTFFVQKIKYGITHVGSALQFNNPMDHHFPGDQMDYI